MSWTVEFMDEFDAEFDALPEPVQDELLAQAKVIERFGPAAKRPRVDTLNGSKHSNMKELRFDADGGVWRSLLIRAVGPCFWSEETSPVSVKNVSTSGS
jgi:hypothetical protein